jgi:hypothetical protein
LTRRGGASTIGRRTWRGGGNRWRRHNTDRATPLEAIINRRSARQLDAEGRFARLVEGRS